MNRRRKFLSILLAALALCLILAGAALAETAGTAVSVQLMKTEGTVSVTNNNARELTILEKMRLYSGYFVETREKSYAWVNLDDAKLAKLDAAGRLELRKDGKKLALLIHEGSLFFNVTEPLKEDETMDICTATMVAGIRGTCGWVHRTGCMDAELCVLEGEVQTTFRNPLTGKQEKITVRSGEKAVFQSNRKGEADSVSIGKIKREQIPGYVLVELAGDDTLLKKIHDMSGLDLTDLTKEEAMRRLEEDQAETEKRIQELAEREVQEKVISKTPVWEKETAANSKKPETEQETKPNKEPDKKPDSKPSKEPITEPETEPETEPVTITEPETEPVTEPVTITEPETEPVTEPVTEPETEPETEPKTEPVTEPKTEPVTEPETEPETEPKTEPVTEPETEPKTEPETKPVTYTVGFDDGNRIQEIQVTENSTAEMPADPVREGYTFGGWQTESGTMFTAETVVTGNMTVKANWTVNSYTVTYFLDGEQSGEVETYEYGAAVTIREKAVKEGYTVTEWSKTEDFTMPAENVTITATSTINSYTVTYLLDGSAYGEAETYEYGAAVTIREKAAKEGYTVTDWSKTEDFTMPAENVTITATSTVNSYTVTYLLDGEQSGEVETYEYGAAVTIREKASKEGYTVTDWSKTEDFTMPAENVTITATSTINSYTVTYLLDGSAYGEAETYEYGAAVTIREKAVKEGYTVTDWSKTEDFTMPAENVTITATSTINSYTVTYLLDGEQVGEAETYEYGATVTIREKAVKEGYTVTDWSKTEDFTMPAENVTITATSTVNSYTVTYLLDGEQSGETEIYEYGAAVTIREKAVKEGYTVTDWSKAEDFTMPAENVTITATSTINVYTITFDANGGTLSGAGEATAEHNTTLTLPEDPVKPGYTFQGWFTEAEGGTEFTAATVVTADDALYAHWTAAEAKIVFDPNGGTGGPQGLTGVTDEAITAAFPVEEPTRDGFTFLEWNTGEDGLGETVTAYPSAFPAETTTYYAKWGYITGDFTVIGGTPLVDFKYETIANAEVAGAGVLTILTGEPLIIKGSTTKDRIAVAEGASADMTLSDVSINLENRSYLEAPVTVSGAASTVITLEGSNTLKAGAGNAGLEKNGVAGTLTICGNGSLNAVGEGSAGIGASEGESGNITIESGEIYAQGRASGAGIGGGYYGNGSYITINGGTVTAIGGPYAAGIGGGGTGGNGTNITISGGTVNATGGEYGGAGIGGGLYGGAGTNITIKGGSVTAVGGGSSNGGAGIGGGGSSREYDGTVVKVGSGSDIFISGGIVRTTADTNASYIGDGSDGSTEIENFTKGIIFKGASGKVYGEVTLSRNLTIASGETLHIPAGAKLIIPSGVTLTNNGTITYDAEKQEDAISGTIAGSGTVEPAIAVAALSLEEESESETVETESESETPTEPVTESETSDTEPDSEAPAESETESGTPDTEPVTESEAPAEPETESGTPDTEPGSEAPAKPETESGTPDTEPVTESEAPTEAAAESEAPAAEPESSAPTDTEAQAAPENAAVSEITSADTNGEEVS